MATDLDRLVNTLRELYRQRKSAPQFEYFEISKEEKAKLPTSEVMQLKKFILEMERLEWVYKYRQSLKFPVSIVFTDKGINVVNKSKR